MARCYPKWATPNRRDYLVKLFLDSNGFCVYGHKPCLIPEHHYQLHIDLLVEDWKDNDRVERQAEWEAEREQLHRVSDRRYPLNGQFSGVSRDIFYDKQPIYYLDGFGINCLTFKPFAKIRLASGYVNLYIDLRDAFKGLSKSKRRKSIRYGKPLPYLIEREIADICKSAVRHYLKSR